jgi:hypothetical protein
VIRPVLNNRLNEVGCKQREPQDAAYVVAQDVFSRRRAIGYRSARLLVPPVQEAEAFRG